MQMSFSPIQGSNLIEKQYKRYLGTMFSLNDPDYQKEFERQLKAHSMFVAGPYLDAHDNFAAGRTTRELVRDGKLPSFFLKYGFYHDRPLYTHQEQALMKALDGKNIVVSTGTGSGKTESFLMPILAGLAREAEQHTLTPGVRALLIYPMNALANDQVERLRTLLEQTPGVTFGCYTGQTQEKTEKALAEYEKLNKRKPRENELISREQMKETPPHILITNYAMLEYLMVRPGDKVFFQDDTWRYVVLDEAHVYRGSTGIEVAMLLRRLKATLHRCSLQYFITSATLGNEKENAEVAAFASNLTDEPFAEQDVIRAVRVPVPKPMNQITVPDGVYRSVSERISEGNQESEIGRWLLSEHPEYNLNPDHPLFDMIHRDEKYWKLRTLLKTPKTIRTICDQLNMTEDMVGHFVEAASFSEADGIRLLDARYHTFLRATDSIFITLPPNKRLFLNRTREWKDPSSHLQYKVFEISTCNACHAIYLTGQLNTETHVLEQSSKSGAKDIFYLGANASNTDEDTLENESDGMPGKICALCGHFRNTQARVEKTCEHGTQYEVPVVQIKTKGLDHRLKKCVCCEAVNSNGILRNFFTGQEAVTSVIATSLFNALPAKTTVKTEQSMIADDFGFGLEEDGSENDASEVNQAKQFLCFSDSRQSSAYFATYLDTSYRKLLYRRIMTEQAGEMRRPMAIKHFCEDLSAVFERQGILRGTDYRSVKESWKAVLAEAADMTSDASLQGMGVIAMGLEPGLFSANPKLRMSAEEVNTLFSVLIGSMINDLAIQIPIPMTEEDREFYSYGMSGARYVALGGDSSKNLKSFIPKSESRSNKRLDYIKRMLEKKVPGAMDDAIARRLMMTLWSMMQRMELITPVDDGFQLNPDKLFVFRPAHWYRCSRCHKLTPYNIEGTCMTYHCSGHLEETNPAEELADNHYYRLYHDMEMRPLRVKEHTAQLNRDQAYEYQQDFKDKKIDVLSCSTTFEMGVDVGSLETVFMRNMPPMPSNYAQRAGRAGRSRNSAAFALTFCNRSSHDFAFFEHPEDMIRGNIHAPHFNIINEKIAIRHLYASSMGFFWSKYPTFFSTVGRMSSEEERQQGQNGFSVLKQYLQTKPDALRTYAKNFLPSQLYEAFDCEHFGWLNGLLDEQEGLLTRAVGEYNYEVGMLEKARVDAFNAGHSTGYYEQRLKTYRNESILSFLSRKNVMPQYGFPVDTVSLSITSRRGEQQFGVELQRDLAMAISEYAPGSQVVANGELFTGRYIRKVPSIGWKTYDYSYCKDCGTLNIHVNTREANHTELSECRMCGLKIEEGDIKTFLIPSFGFEIDPESIRKPGLVRPETTYRTDVSYVGYRNDIEMKPVQVKHSTALVMFSEKDEMAVMNRSDFHVCDVCGYGEVGQGFLYSVMKDHNMANGRKCKNNRLRRYSLGYRFETDVFMINFPDHPIAYGNEGKAYSVLYAMLRGIVDVLNLEENDVAGCLQSINSAVGRGYSFVFYDTTPGGAGHMRRLQDASLLNMAVERARELMMRCTCGGQEGHASCYACLRSYRNQKLHDLLDRSLAIEYLSQL